MVRPTERFTVNVRNEEQPAPRLSRSTSRPSTGTVVVAAAVLGTGIGGLLPAAWAPAPSAPELVAVLPAAPDLAGIEPAAGPAGGEMVVARVPDDAFYVPVFLDQVPLTMRLDPAAARTSLSAHDAGRLATGSDRGVAGVRVGEVRLGPARVGPVSLPVDAIGLPASVLGADLLDRLAVVAPDGERLRLTPR
jgi:hypothetical protein